MLHSPNSPVLVLIETLHGFERRAPRDSRVNVDNARQSTNDEADRRMKGWWQGEDNDNLIAIEGLTLAIASEMIRNTSNCLY